MNKTVKNDIKVGVPWHRGRLHIPRKFAVKVSLVTISIELQVYYAFDFGVLDLSDWCSDIGLCHSYWFPDQSIACKISTAQNNQRGVKWKWINYLTKFSRSN